MNVSHQRTWVVAIAVGLITAVCVSDLRAQKRQPPRIALQTVYLSEKIGDAHRIIIQGELGGEATVTLDGNTCTLSLFGDTAICTKVFFPPIDVKMNALRVADPTGQGRRVYRLQGDLKPEDFAYYLIVPRRRSQPHRLVVDMGEDRRRVVSLEPIPEKSDQGGGGKDPGRPLCRHAEYRAVQTDGKVVIYATGEHPTAGWQTEFEMLPIRIFPPQYRLICQRPEGLAAQVMTPFEVKTSFKAKDPIDHVVVHDARGKHEVPVRRQ